MTRWHQGGINLVVNTEKEGFAHSFNITHGSAVCALGLKVENAAATFERATLLLDQPFRQAVGPGELDIPAVRGVGGSLLYFLDEKSDLGRVWDIEFEESGDDGSNGGGTYDRRPCLAVHALRGNALLAAVLHVAAGPQEGAGAGRCRSRRTCEEPGHRVAGRKHPHHPQCLAKPAHAVLALPDRAVRLRGAAYRFRHRRYLRHRERLKENGVKLLPIPENYYDDLEAKTDLSADKLDALRANNILYDREGDGEYLQAYTEAFEQRFFFEIVQRRDYRGYGAANAPIRLAAQSLNASRQEIL